MLLLLQQSNLLHFETLQYFRLHSCLKWSSCPLLCLHQAMDGNMGGNTVMFSLRSILPISHAPTSAFLSLCTNSERILIKFMGGNVYRQQKNWFDFGRHCTRNNRAGRDRKFEPTSNRCGQNIWHTVSAGLASPLCTCSDRGEASYDCMQSFALWFSSELISHEILSGTCVQEDHGQPIFGAQFNYFSGVGEGLLLATVGSNRVLYCLANVTYLILCSYIYWTWMNALLCFMSELWEKISNMRQSSACFFLWQLLCIGYKNLFCMSAALQATCFLLASGSAYIL